MNECQKRSVAVLKDTLNQHRGHKIALGTHGAVMTLMMNYFDAKYDLSFLLQTTKPDIYRMEFAANGTFTDYRIASYWRLVSLPLHLRCIHEGFPKP